MSIHDTRPPAISAACQRLLEEQRGALNARFQQSRALGVRVSPAVWLAHLQTGILPLVDAVHAVMPERAGLALRELYDVSLELRQCGAWNESADVASQGLQRLWQQVLPLVPRLIAHDPRGIAGSLSNAVLTLARLGKVEVRRWLERMERSASSTESGEQLLQVGLVAAWTAGLAEYRLPALQLAEKLPAELQRLLFDTGPETNAAELARILQRWSTHPWYNWSATTVDHSSIQLRQVCGSFRGFGGKFLYPPRVFIRDQQLLVTDRQTVWRLIGDVFGHTFKRSDAPAPKRFTTVTAAGKIDVRGLIRWEENEAHYPALANSNSQACDGQTLAVTLPDSFHVFLFARNETLCEK